MPGRLKPGTVLDGFRVESALHAGGNGYIYAVTPVAPRVCDIPLVMKVPGVGPGETALGLVSFEIEQMIHPTLTGPHVPRLVATGTAERLPYLVMERIEGSSLATFVQRAPLAGEEVARIGAALADAVHSVHRQEVIHLDLKPENVILRSEGEAVLLDFGFARHHRFPDLLAEEQDHAAGSAAYVSPEQLQGVRSDPRSDVFALGVLLFELATGQPPFGEPATLAGMRDRLWRHPPPPRSFNTDVPRWLQEIILGAIEIDPSRRYASAAHIAFDLRNPAQVRLTERAFRVARSGFIAQARNWWRAKRRVGELAQPLAGMNAVRVILVAVDTEHPDDERHPALRATTRSIVSLSANLRLMFVSVIRAPPLGEGDQLEDTTSGRHLEHHNRLRHWVEPLRLPPTRQSLHVIEARDPGQALLGLARANHVDLIVIGAPGPAQRALAWWRSAASTVAGNAHCSVHVVRVSERGTAAAEAD